MLMLALTCFENAKRLRKSVQDHGTIYSVSVTHVKSQQGTDELSKFGRVNKRYLTGSQTVPSLRETW
jgi:hypothetical protein